MMEFLIAAAVGSIFSLRWSSILWPVGAMLVAISTVAGSLLSSAPMLSALLTTFGGYNLGLCAGIVVMLAGGPARTARASEIAKNLPSET